LFRDRYPEMVRLADVLGVRDIPPVTPFVPMKFVADHATIWDFLWFGYVPQDTAAGIALCQFNQGAASTTGGAAAGRAACRAGRRPG